MQNMQTYGLTMLGEGYPNFACLRVLSYRYNERKDVNTLMVMGQLVSKTRTRRPTRPVARFEPPQLEIKPKKTRDAAEVERRRQQKRRRKRKEEKKRRALKRRLRELKAKVFSEGEMSLER